MNGYLIVNVFADNIAQPVEGANVKIIDGSEIFDLTTNESGQTEQIELSAPNLEYSMVPQHEHKPFATYDVKVSKPGLIPMTVKHVEVYPGVVSYQNIYLATVGEIAAEEQIIVIDDPNIWEGPSKFDETAEAFEFEQEEFIKSPFISPMVFIPEYIIVHDGYPTNTAAATYFVSFIDYIKNVTCSEIYSTWPRETIKANVYAIISFTLNRVYSEWYLAKGHFFTITSSPEYDQKFTPGRTIFNTIASVVDEVFQYYITYGTNTHPLLAQYFSGSSGETRPGWLSQWGSKDLGDRGYTALAILKYFYGNNISLNIADVVIGLPTSFPGFNMAVGSCGEEVQRVQNRLNTIRGSYPALPAIFPADGEFGASTETAVRTFQSVFGLPITGVIDFATWFKISYVYIGVTRMIQGIIT